MNVDHAIDIVVHDLILARNGLRPETIPALTVRLADLRAEKWRLWRQGLDLDTRREAQYRPKPRPETCLVPRGPDEWMDGHGNWHVQDCTLRPDV